MNTDDENLECSCDVGPFATCPVCSMSDGLSLKAIQEIGKQEKYWRQKRQRERSTKISPMDIWQYSKSK